MNADLAAMAVLVMAAATSCVSPTAILQLVALRLPCYVFGASDMLCVAGEKRWALVAPMFQSPISLSMVGQGAIFSQLLDWGSLKFSGTVRIVSVLAACIVCVLGARHWQSSDARIAKWLGDDDLTEDTRVQRCIARAAICRLIAAFGIIVGVWEYFAEGDQLNLAVRCIFCGFAILIKPSFNSYVTYNVLAWFGCGLILPARLAMHATGVESVNESIFWNFTWGQSVGMFVILDSTTQHACLSLWQSTVALCCLQSGPLKLAYVMLRAFSLLLRVALRHRITSITRDGGQLSHTEQGAVLGVLAAFGCALSQVIKDTSLHHMPPRHMLGYAAGVMAPCAAWFHKRFDDEVMQWLTVGDVPAESDSERHSRCSVRVDILWGLHAGFAAIGGAFALMLDHSHAGWQLLVCRVGCSATFVAIKPSYDWSRRMVWFMDTVLAPYLILQFPQHERGLFWLLPAFVNPLQLLIMCESPAEHAALAQWQCAFAMCSCHSFDSYSWPVVVVMAHCCSFVAHLGFLYHSNFSVFHRQAGLRGMFKAMNQFHDVLDHQLKNNFIGEVACLELMEENMGTWSAAEMKQHIQQSKECMNRGVTQCYNQQALRDICNGTYQIQPRQMLLSKLLENVCGGQATITIAEMSSWKLMIDPVIFEHILTNGLSNARKYGDGSAPELTCTFDDDQELLHIILTNRAGVNHADVLDLVRSRPGGELELTKSGVDGATALQKAHESSGIGSTVCGMCVEVAGPPARVYLSADAESTSFHCIMPAARAAEPEGSALTKADTTEVANASLSRSLDGLHVVLLDDQPMMQRVFKLRTEKLGARCTVLSFTSLCDLKNAIESAVTLAPDMLVVDGQLGSESEYGQHARGEHVIACVLEMGFAGCTVFHSGDEERQPCKAFGTLKKTDIGTFSNKLEGIWGRFCEDKPFFGMQIAVVDDTPSAVMALQLNLKKRGAVVISFADGCEFLADCRAAQGSCRQWDAVVLDHTMPQMTGLQTIQKLPNYVLRVPIVIYSTEAKKDDLYERYMQAGALECVPKTGSSWKRVLDILAAHWPAAARASYYPLAASK